MSILQKVNGTFQQLAGYDKTGVDADMSNYLSKDNTEAYTPIGDYQPATKKYVDDKAGSSGGMQAVKFPWLIGLGTSPTSATIERRFTDSGHDFDYWYDYLGFDYGTEYVQLYAQTYGRGETGWVTTTYPVVYAGQAQGWDYTAIDVCYIDPYPWNSNDCKVCHVKIYKDSSSGELSTEKRGTLACFTGDTLIKTPDGYKSIEDLKIGDEVLTQNPEGEMITENITNKIDHIADKVITITLDNGEVINATPSHPFFVRAVGRPILAEELQVGYKLCNPVDRKYIAIKDIKVDENPNEVRVYEIVLPVDKNYCVSKSDIMVHNEPSVLIS